MFYTMNSESELMHYDVFYISQVRVAEESGVARLLVVRAMGYQGEISVEWRTTDGTAKSSGKTPIDYSVSFNFLPTDFHVQMNSG